MYPITSAVKALFDAEQRKVLRITGQDVHGETISLTDEDIMQGSFSIDRYACNGEKLEIGTAIASELKLKLDNSTGAFDDILFEGAELFVEIGLADWTQDEPTISYIPCGYFTSDEQPRSLDIITLNALDRMVNFDKFKDLTLKPWSTNTGAIVTDGSGNIIYFVQDVILPCTVAQVVAQIASSCNVPFDQDLTNFPNASYTVTALPVINKETTFRNIIQWCAGLMGTNAWIDWDGKLRFSWFNNTTGYVSTTANRYKSDLYEDAVEITGVMFKDDDEDSTVYLAGTDDYALDVSSNGMINADNASTILTNIYNTVHNFAYTPFSASVVAAPYLWPMDRVTFTDKNDVGHVSSLTNVNFGLNGTTAIQANGKSAKTNSYAPTGNFTASQRAELKKIAGVTSSEMQQAVEHATEMITGGLGGYVVLNVNEETGETEEILIMDNPDKTLAVNVWRFNQGGLGHSSNGYNGPFNDVALTADGRINANMITAGTLNADIIRSGTISDYNGNNSWNLATGALTMTGGTIDIGDFEVDSTGKLTCTGADISGELHTTNVAGTYYIDIEGGELHAGKIENNTKTETGNIKFATITYGESGSTYTYPGVQISSQKLMRINATSRLEIESTNAGVVIKSEDHGVSLYTDSAGIYVGYLTDTGTIRIEATTLNLGTYEFPNGPTSTDVIIGNRNSGYVLINGPIYTDWYASGYQGITGGYWSWIWGSSWNTNQPLYLEFCNGLCVGAHY